MTPEEQAARQIDQHRRCMSHSTGPMPGCIPCLVRGYTIDEIQPIVAAALRAALEEERGWCRVYENDLISRTRKESEERIRTLEAEVERLKAESAEKGRWSAHWHGEMLEREAALARVRAALEASASRVFLTRDESSFIL